MPGGVVPIIEFKDGNNVKKLGQTGALTRFLARTYGYYPSNALQAYKVDAIVDHYLDVIAKFYMGVFT